MDGDDPESFRSGLTYRTAYGLAADLTDSLRGLSPRVPRTIPHAPGCPSAG